MSFWLLQNSSSYYERLVITKMYDAYYVWLLKEVNLDVVSTANDLSITFDRKLNFHGDTWNNLGVRF